MALVKTMLWFGARRGLWAGALVWFATSWVACSELDPVSVENLCEGPGPVLDECPQCQSELLAPECPLCQQSPPDERCVAFTEGSEQEPVTGVGGDGGIDPGASGEGGEGAPGVPPENGEVPKAGEGAMGAAGDRATPGDPGNAGNDPGQPPGQTTPRACSSDADCTDPGAPACRPDGVCIECLRHEHCGEGGQCDNTRNLCVECVDNAGCEAAGLVCSPNTRKCVECLGNGDCHDPAAPACTPTNQCVACTDDSFCPDDAPACDAMACYECKNDSYCNGPGKHACIEEEHRCVECETDLHCRSESGRPRCLVEDNACVECLSNDDCSDTAASLCDEESHTCVPCTRHADCAGFASTAPRCVEGKGCVPCDDDGGICGDKACILSENRCSTVDQGSVEACGRCVTSDECVAGHVCVSTKFGSYDTGDVCLPSMPSFKACPRPFGREVPNAPTLDGFRVEALCTLPENTTCRALADTLARKPCYDNNAACGYGRTVLGTNDGVCTTACTYNCTDNKFCPNGMTCNVTQAVCQ